MTSFAPHIGATNAIAQALAWSRILSRTWTANIEPSPPAMVAPLLVLSFIWQAPLAVVIPATVIPLLAITLPILVAAEGGL